MRGKNPRTGAKEAFDERTYGLTLSGPILKDRLFFAFSFEDFERESASPSLNALPSAPKKRRYGPFGAPSACHRTTPGPGGTRRRKS